MGGLRGGKVMLLSDQLRVREEGLFSNDGQVLTRVEALALTSISGQHTPCPNRERAVQKLRTRNTPFP
jgi:hypothetical protein